MYKCKGVPTFFCVFLVINSLVCVTVVLWVGPSLPRTYTFVPRQQGALLDVNVTGLPGRPENISSRNASSATATKTSETTLDNEAHESEAYFEKLFPLSPDEELRKKSDELKNLTPAQYYAKLNQSLQEAQKRKSILIEIWRPSFGRKTPSFTDYQCGSCQVGYTLDKANDSRTKALIYHFHMADKGKHFPGKRRPEQYYIWQTRESSSHIPYYRIDLAKFNNFFNMTMTPRRYGDVLDPYGSGAILHDRLKLPMTDKQIDEMIRKKDKLGLWVVSNCGSYSGMKAARLRMDYAKKLAALGLDLTLGGKCFRDKSKNFENYRYKFYLAFENSWNCSDYVSEKFWRNSLEWGSVPVVLGAKKSDIIETAPPNSFVYAHDFESAEKLAEYLLYLDKNTTAYREYFMWRKLRRSDMPYYRRADRMCQLCRIVNGINIDNLFNTKYEERFKHIPMFGYPKTDRVVPSIEDYLYKDENEGCIDSPPK